MNLAVPKKGKILTSLGIGAPGAAYAAYAAQFGAKVLYLLEETLGEVVVVESVTMVTMQASKTAIADDVKVLSLLAL